MTDPLLLDATSQLQLLAMRQISALELLDASAARASAVAATVNPLAAKALDAARVRAHAFDERRARGESPETLGLLAGLAMTIKDVLDVDDMPASSGVAGYVHRAAADAEAVSRVKAAGAVVWAKTNVPPQAGDWQTVNDVYGLTRNPWDLTRTPGGSSGGAAAALAVGATALEIGSDIAGSLRAPAGFCGVFSHKPTFGLVSQRGHVPPRPGVAREADMNVIGPMARSARDLRLLLSVLSPAALPARAPPATLIGLKAALWLEEPVFALDPEVGRVVAGWARDLALAGVHVEPVAAPVAARNLLETFQILLMAQWGAAMTGSRWRGLAQRRPLAALSRRLGAGPVSNAARILALTASHRDWLAADEARAQMSRAVVKFFTRHDVLICPAVGVAAFPHDHSKAARRRLRLSEGGFVPYASLLHWAAFASALGLPSTTVPAGRTAAGLPVGVQVIGPVGTDSRTLAVAQAVEEALGGFRPPSLLDTLLGRRS